MRHSLWQHTLGHSAGSRLLELWHRLPLQAIQRSACTHLEIKWMREITRWVTLCKLRWKEELLSLSFLGLTTQAHGDSAVRWRERPLAFLAISELSFLTTRSHRRHPVPHFRDEVSERVSTHIFPEHLLCVRQHIKFIIGTKQGIKYSPCSLRITIQWGRQTRTQMTPE